MNWMKLIGLVIVCELAGIIGAFFTVQSIPDWYSGLNKPSFSPPNWVFGPVWTALYAMMGVAAYLVLEKGLEKKEVKVAMGMFALQLFLNFIWTPLFFGLRNPFYALFVIIALWFVLLATIFQFLKLDRVAGALLVPYILWVSFASLLNYSIWALN